MARFHSWRYLGRNASYDLSRRSLLKAIAGVGIGVMAPPGCFRRSGSEPELFVDAAARLIKEANIAGFSVATVVEGHPSWTAAVGLRNVDQALPMLPTSIQNVASVSKLLTATMAMQLVERNLLSLHDPIEKFIGFQVRNPVFPTDQITVLQLLVHTSSIRDIPVERRAAYHCGPRRSQLAEFIQGYFAEKRGPDRVPFTGNRPGESFLYSNFGYSLLGVVIEGASGQSFEECSRERLFEPLGMKRSGWSFEASTPQERATHYMWVDRNEELERVAGGMDRFLDPPHRVTVDEIRKHIAYCSYNNDNVPASSCWTSAADFVRFLQVFLGAGRPEVLGGGLAQRMLSDEVVRETRLGPYVQGLGWVREPRSDDRIVWTGSGDSPGVSTIVQMEPAAGNGIVLLANSEEVQDLQRGLATKFFRGELSGGD